MSALQDELVKNGYIPQIAFRNDGYAKVLYLVNQSGQDIRITVNGGAYLTNPTLVNQNPTLKKTDVGAVRFHIASA